jgi:hypothetical protein
MGVDATITVAASGTYTLVLEAPGEDPDVTTGAAAVDGNILLTTDDDEPGETTAWVFDMSGNELEMATAEGEFDFDDDGNDEPATVVITLDGATGTTIEDLAGSWMATELRFISEPSQADTVDLIDAGGSLAIVVTLDGRYQVTTMFPGEGTDMETGAIVVGDDELTLIPFDDPSDDIEFDFVLQGDTLSLVGDGEFDFDDKT